MPRVISATGTGIPLPERSRFVPSAECSPLSLVRTTTLRYAVVCIRACKEDRSMDRTPSFSSEERIDLAKHFWRFRGAGLIRRSLVNCFDMPELVAHAELCLRGDLPETVTTVRENGWNLKRWLDARILRTYHGLFEEESAEPRPVLLQLVA